MKTLYALASLLALTSSAFAQEQAAAPANSQTQTQATQSTNQEKTEWEKTAEELDKQLEEGKKMGFW